MVGFVRLVLMMALIGFLLCPPFWLYGIYDIYASAKRINASTLRPD